MIKYMQPKVKTKSKNMSKYLEKSGAGVYSLRFLLCAGNPLLGVPRLSLIHISQIFIQSILPVTMEKSLSENGIYANGKIDRYNRALMEYCKKKGLPFVNVAEALKGADGALPADASSDGMHFGPSYYEKWFDYLRSHTLKGEKEGERKK